MADGSAVKSNDISYVYETPSEETVPYDGYSGTNELKGIAGIISEKQAEKIARGSKIINIPKNYALKNICGYNDSDNVNRYFYTLLFAGSKRSDYAEVMLDAKSGEIVNFSRPQNKGKSVITNEKAKKIAKKLLRFLLPSIQTIICLIMPEKTAYSRLSGM